MENKLIALIPARGRSKGISRKNIRPLLGKPLIAWAIEAALNCPSLDRVIVSTDDKEIASIARENGAEVPFIRPHELAKDDTPDFPVFKHALEWLGDFENYCPDIVAWLRPTAPLIMVEDIEGAIKLLNNTGADCVRSVCLAEHHPYWMKYMEGDRIISLIKELDEKKYPYRQLLPPVYRLNGAVDVVLNKTALEKGSLFEGDMRGYIMPADKSLDIDSEIDFVLAEMMLRKRFEDD